MNADVKTTQREVTNAPVAVLAGGAAVEPACPPVCEDVAPAVLLDEEVGR